MLANKGTIKVSNVVDSIIHPGTKETRGYCLKKWMEDLKKQGIEIRTGPWVKAEDDLLTHNWNKYIANHPMENPVKLLRMNYFDDKSARKRLKKIIKDTDFYSKISRNLNRFTESCCRRALCLFGYFKKGPLSSQEKQIVEKVLLKHGKCWAKIGNLLGRCPSDVERRWRNKIEKVGKKSGFWTVSEEEQLIQSVKTVTGKRELWDVMGSKLDFKKIAEGVPTRSVHQCREHWFKCLNSLIKLEYNIHIPRWNKQDESKLIEKIYMMEITEELQIDWEELMTDFPKCNTVSRLRTRWNIIKRSISDSAILSFEEVRDRAFANLVAEIENDMSESDTGNEERNISTSEGKESSYNSKDKQKEGFQSEIVDAQPHLENVAMATSKQCIKDETSDDEMEFLETFNELFMQ